MRFFAPDYYARFACIAHRCRHSCCVGWEIDIDPDSLRRFRAVEGDLGLKLRESIREDEDGAHFRLDAEERCPFLMEDGLCELILRLGEDSLCQICADHPRFRAFYTGRTEIGLGLCCEAAARLILTWPDPVRLIVIGDDGAGDDPLPDDEQELLSARDALIAHMQRRELPLSRRVLTLPALCGCPWPDASPAWWAQTLADLERLDPAWDAQLRRLASLGDAPAPWDIADLEPWAVPLEQLMVALLCRHLPAALDDGDLPGHVLVCCALWQTAAWLFTLSERTMDDLVDIVRMLSSELEYSQDNLDALLALFE